MTRFLLGARAPGKKFFKLAKGPDSDNGYSIVHDQMKLDAADASLTNTNQLLAQWAPVLSRIGVTVPKYRRFTDLLHPKLDFKKRQFKKPLVGRS